MGFGGGLTFNPTSSAHATGMGGKVYRQAEAGPMSVESKLQGTYDIAPGRLEMLSQSWVT